MTISSYEKIIQLITAAYQDNKLDHSLTLELIPALAEVLEPHLKRYITKYDSWPAPKIFQAIVNNFIQDGPRVQMLLAIDSPDAAKLWGQLRENLVEIVRRNWSKISSAYQEEIADRALIRIERSLPDFLYMARFSTWVFKILMNEYLRLEKKIKAELEKEISLEQEMMGGTEVGEGLLSSDPDPAEIVEHSQVIADLRQQIDRLGNELDVKILRLHLGGYTLEEIKKILGQNAPAVATIKRYKDRLLERIKADPLIKEIAQQLGILPGGESGQTDYDKVE